MKLSKKLKTILSGVAKTNGHSLDGCFFQFNSSDNSISIYSEFGETDFDPPEFIACINVEDYDFEYVEVVNRSKLNLN